MKVKLEQAVTMARNNESLKGVVVEDLNDTQVRAADALILAEHGIVIPEQNIYYQDEDIAYDPDFDETDWSKEPLNMAWEEKVHLAEKMAKYGAFEEEISVRINIPDREIREWMHNNRDKMGQILANFIVDIYKANRIIKG